MHGTEILAFIQSSRAYSPEFLHVPPGTDQEPQMHAEGSDVGSGLAADPEDAKVAILVIFNEFALIDGANSQLALNSRDERRALK